MKQLQQYIMEVLGIEIQQEVIDKKGIEMLPLFLREIYRLYNASLFNQAFILVEKTDNEAFSVHQTEKHFNLIKGAYNRKIVLLTSEMSSLNRKRLVEKGINFIVPGKQLYLPDFLIDLREDFKKGKIKPQKLKLLPSAQFILLYRILHRNEKPGIEDLSFKELASKLKYTPMAITFAAENLMQLEICNIVGEKEKYLRFNVENREMWHDLDQRKLLLNPVIKKIYVDEIPENIHLLHCNMSALPEYSDMNPSRQEYFSIEKNMFYSLLKSNALINTNKHEGKYCLEIWKYNSLKLVEKLFNDSNVVDPLSLYLSLKDNKDERIEMSLEQIIQKFIW